MNSAKMRITKNVIRMRQQWYYWIVKAYPFRAKERKKRRKPRNDEHFMGSTCISSLTLNAFPLHLYIVQLRTLSVFPPLSSESEIRNSPWPFGYEKKVWKSLTPQNGDLAQVASDIAFLMIRFKSPAHSLRGSLLVNYKSKSSCCRSDSPTSFHLTSDSAFLFTTGCDSNKRICLSYSVALLCHSPPQCRV